MTIVSFEEQMRGWLAYIARAQDFGGQIPAYSRLHALLEDYCDRPILDFDEPSAKMARQLTGQKVRIGTMDLKIASITLASSATLITRNLTDFRKVPGLAVEDWTS